ncbi:MAG: hypothetical protein Kow0080_12050 [Candidatus Promineifilaceae bacterium]
MKKVCPLFFVVLPLFVMAFSTIFTTNAQSSITIFLPFVARPIEPNYELRGIWLTRYDWTSLFSPESPADIDAMVQNIADAGFNAIFFQVRSEADAYYNSSLEPWSRRLAGTLGVNPGWDPLARMIEQAHARNIQVHAYVNVYTLWSDLNVNGVNCDDLPLETAVPQPLFYQMQNQHGTTSSLPGLIKLNGAQWDTNNQIVCADGYVWATPASSFFNDHMVAVAKEIVNNYDVDGLHLDRIRYGADGANASCDPVSAAVSGTACFDNANPPAGYATYGDWQRDQINKLLARIYNEAVLPASRPVMLSAAVWPIHELDPSWTNFSGSPQQGNIHYYQDSKAWLTNGIIDGIAPMIYPALYGSCDSGGNYVQGNDYWTRDRWQTLVTDYVANSNGRFITPGIGGNYCDFAEIEARINMARTIGAAGHVIFSYRHLNNHAYFDDLKNGPYTETAVPPVMNWRP